METTVEIYTPPITGTALDPARTGTLESEVTLMELDLKAKHANALGLSGVVKGCTQQKTTILLSREIDFPLLTAEEVRVWRAFLPMRYRTPLKDHESSPFAGPRTMATYAFDLPPVSVLELWSTLQSANTFDTYEIWTPERVMPEPILLGYREQIGPFLIARWGESLESFEAIKAQVDAPRPAVQTPQAAWEAIQQQQLQDGLAGLLSSQLGGGGLRGLPPR